MTTLNLSNYFDSVPSKQKMSEVMVEFETIQKYFRLENQGGHKIASVKC